MTLCDWSVSTMDIDLKIRPLAHEVILNYRFDNGLGGKFRVRPLNNGNIEVESNERLIIIPVASNSIEIGVCDQ